MRSTAVGFCLGLSLAACASAFPYKYFGVAPDEHGELKGTLQSSDAEDDRPISECAPSGQDKGKCAVFFREELQRMRDERVELLERLKACEQRDS